MLHIRKIPYCPLTTPCQIFEQQGDMAVRPRHPAVPIKSGTMYLIHCYAKATWQCVALSFC